MASGEDLNNFPDISSKLSAPKKLSAYSKEKRAQEAKAQRELLETADQLREFEEEHGSSRSEYGSTGNSYSRPHGFRGHDSTSGKFGGQYPVPRSGPGSLGPLPPPPPSIKRKREMLQAEAARREEDDFADDIGGTGEGSDADEIIPHRAILLLSHLPPGTWPTDVADLFELLEEECEVYDISFISAPNIKNTVSVLVTLEHSVPTKAVDAAIKALNGKYLGGGCSLKVEKHLSSAPSNVPLSSELAFGAQKVKKPAGSGNLRNAPPPQQFAPPGAFDSRGSSGPPVDAEVQVSIPDDPGAVKAINIIAGHLLSQENPARAVEKEVSILSQSSVYYDEHFRFLYDASSQAGVYYRYLMTCDQGPTSTRPFNDVNYEWIAPHPSLPLPNVNCLADFMEVMDDDSDLDESDEEDEKRRFNNGPRDGQQGLSAAPQRYYTSLKHARLTWVLSRLPTTTSTLKIIDVAHVTSFAMDHASDGVEPVAELILYNVHNPICLMYERIGPEDGGEGNGNVSTDESSAKLVGLYVINDILLNARSGGGMHAWKYRKCFEAGFRAQKTFEHLGQLDKQYGWGRIKTEQWKNKVQYILDMWGQQSIFDTASVEEFSNRFLGKHIEDSHDSRNGSGTTKSQQPHESLKPSVMSRFKKVGGGGGTVSASGSNSSSPFPTDLPAPNSDADHEMSDARHDLDGTPMDDDDDDLDGVPMDDLDGVPMDDDGDLDGVPMDEVGAADTTDLDGIPMDDDLDGTPMEGVSEAPRASEDPPKQAKMGFSMGIKSAADTKGEADGKSTVVEGKRRMLAEDMFALSDEE